MVTDNLLATDTGMQSSGRAVAAERERSSATKRFILMASRTNDYIRRNLSGIPPRPGLSVSQFDTIRTPLVDYCMFHHRCTFSKRMELLEGTVHSTVWVNNTSDSQKENFGRLDMKTLARRYGVMCLTVEELETQQHDIDTHVTSDSAGFTRWNEWKKGST